MVWSALSGIADAVGVQEGEGGGEVAEGRAVRALSAAAAAFPQSAARRFAPCNIAMGRQARQQTVRVLARRALAMKKSIEVLTL